jgi:hypothetical protein
MTYNLLPQQTKDEGAAVVSQSRGFDAPDPFKPKVTYLGPLKKNMDNAKVLAAGTNVLTDHDRKYSTYTLKYGVDQETLTRLLGYKNFNCQTYVQEVYAEVK